jgi:hypothetical protein
MELMASSLIGAGLLLFVLELLEYFDGEAEE